MWALIKSIWRGLRDKPYSGEPLPGPEISLSGVGGLTSKAELERLGLRKCGGCGEFFHKSWGGLCPECSGA